MSKQELKHIINRYTFEVEVGEKERAHSIQNQLSQIFTYKLTKILDKVLSEVSDPYTVYRIKRLEIDLGEFEEKRLEIEMPERLEKQLRRKLKDLIAFNKLEIDVMGPTAKAITTEQSNLEALTYFLENGRLSIWTKMEGFSPEKILTQLAEEAPEQLRRSLQKIGDSPAVIQRLTYQFQQPAIEKIYGLLAPTHRMFLGEYATQMFRTLQAVPGLHFGGNDLRHRINESILFYLLREKSLVFDKNAFIKSIKRQLIDVLEIAPEDFIPSKTADKIPQIATENLDEKIETIIQTYILPTIDIQDVPEEEAESRQRVLIRLLEKQPAKLYQKLQQKKIGDWQKTFTALEKALPQKQQKLLPKFVEFVNIELKKEERALHIQTVELEKIVTLLVKKSPSLPSKKEEKENFQDLLTIILIEFPKKLISTLQKKGVKKWDEIINKIVRLLPKKEQKTILQFAKIILTEKIDDNFGQKIEDKSIDKALVKIKETLTGRKEQFPPLTDTQDLYPEPKIFLPGEKPADESTRASTPLSPLSEQDDPSPKSKEQNDPTPQQQEQNQQSTEKQDDSLNTPLTDQSRNQQDQSQTPQDQSRNPQDQGQYPQDQNQSLQTDQSQNSQDDQSRSSQDDQSRSSQDERSRSQDPSDQEWQQNVNRSSQEQSPYYKLIQDRKRKEEQKSAPKKEADFKEASVPALMDYLAFYLANAKAPWWATGHVYQNFEQLFVQLATEKPKEVTTLLSDIRNKGTAAAKRAVLTVFTPKMRPVTLQKLTELLEPDFAGFIISTVLAIEKMDQKTIAPKAKGRLEATVVSKLRQLKDFAWEPALHYLMATTSNSFDMNKFLGVVTTKIAKKTGLDKNTATKSLAIVAEEAAENEVRFTPFKNILTFLPETSITVEIQDSISITQKKQPPILSPKESIESSKEVTQDQEKTATSKESPKEETKEKGALSPPKESEDTIDQQKETTVSKTEKEASSKAIDTPAAPSEKPLLLATTKFQDSPYVLLAYFLEYGSLPTKTKQLSGKEFEQEVKNYIQKNDYEIVEIFKHYLKSQNIRRRVALHFSTEIKEAITKLLLVQSQKVLVDHRQIKKIAEKTGKKDIATAVEEHLLYFASHQKTAYFRSYSFFKNLIKYVVREYHIGTKEFLAEVSKALPKASVGPKLQKLVSLLEKEYEQKPQKQFPKEQAETQPKERTVWQMKTKRKPKRGEPIFVQNAGLVLTWPFLPFFFKTLGMLTPLRKFKNEKAACRGAHLLQYLATGHEAEPEHLLPLNKLMCGVPFDFPIEMDVQLTDDEKGLCDALLGQVIKQWAAMKNSSPNGIRGSFLIREGKLTMMKENLWTVKVEPKGFDMLLDSLPWNLKMFTLPWTEDRVAVEWRESEQQF